MARVVDTWPEKRVVPEPIMSYPWDEWTNGKIWLADQGIDFPASSNIPNFRQTLYSYANRYNKGRQRQLDRRIEELRAQGKTIRRVPRIVQLKVKMRVVSDTQIAFQYYKEDNPPDAVEEFETATPKQRRAETPVNRRSPVTPAHAPISRRKRKASV